MTFRRAGAVAAALLIAPALAACGPGLIESSSCASWVDYDTDAERALDADAVLVVTDIEPDGTASVLGFDANAYTAEVVDAEKGSFETGESVRIASTADNCAAEPYGDGDPMLDGDVLRVFLTDDGGLWRTITPFDGVTVVG